MTPAAMFWPCSMHVYLMVSAARKGLPYSSQPATTRMHNNVCPAGHTLPTLDPSSCKLQSITIPSRVASSNAFFRSISSVGPKMVKLIEMMSTFCSIAHLIALSHDGQKMSALINLLHVRTVSDLGSSGSVQTGCTYPRHPPRRHSIPPVSRLGHVELAQRVNGIMNNTI